MLFHLHDNETVAIHCKIGPILSSRSITHLSFLLFFLIALYIYYRVFHW